MIPLVLVLMRIYGRWLELQKMQKCHWHSSGRSELAWLACWSMACTGRQRLKTKKRQTQGGWFATVQFVRKPVAQCFTCCRRHAWVGLPAADRCCQWWENVATAKWKDFLPHSIIFMDNSFLTIKLNNNNKTGAQTNIDHRGNLWQAWESQHMNITKKTQLRRLSRLSSHEACSQIKVGVKWRSPKVLVCASLFIEWKNPCEMMQKSARITNCNWTQVVEEWTFQPW